MTYSIIGSGHQKKRQAIGAFDLLADQERQANRVEEQLDAQDDAQAASGAGSAVGMGGTWFFGSRPGGPAPIEDLTVNKAIPDAALESGATEALTQAGTEALGEAAIGATGEATAADAIATVGAETVATAGAEAAAGGAAAAAEGATTASAFGPIGWVLGAGLLAYSLFG